MPRKLYQYLVDKGIPDISYQRGRIVVKADKDFVIFDDSFCYDQGFFSYSANEQGYKKVSHYIKIIREQERIVRFVIKFFNDPTIICYNGTQTLQLDLGSENRNFLFYLEYLIIYDLDQNGKAIIDYPAAERELTKIFLNEVEKYPRFRNRLLDNEMINTVNNNRFFDLVSTIVNQTTELLKTDI